MSSSSDSGCMLQTITTFAKCISRACSLPAVEGFEYISPQKALYIKRHKRRIKMVADIGLNVMPTFEELCVVGKVTRIALAITSEVNNV